MKRFVPWKLGLTIRRIKLSGFIPIPLPYLPYLFPVPTFRLLSQLEYHEEHCDLSYFTGYCPRAGKFWSVGVNYCPQCILSLARIRGYKLLPGQVVIIDQRQRMTGPIPRTLGQSDLVQTLPQEHIFPPFVQYCPL
jgi:hypothetical protein